MANLSGCSCMSIGQLQVAACQPRHFISLTYFALAMSHSTPVPNLLTSSLPTTL